MTHSADTAVVDFGLTRLVAPAPPHSEPTALPSRGRSRSILCAIDGLALASGRVLPAAIDIARAAHARLTLLSVAPSPSFWTLFCGYSPMRLRDELEEEALMWLAHALALVPADVDAGVVLRRDDPATAIGAVAERGDHDAIVLGRRPCPQHGRRRRSASAARSSPRPPCRSTSCPSRPRSASPRTGPAAMRQTVVASRSAAGPSTFSTR